MSFSPWFEWTKHALSDLGFDGLPALIFNNGIILVGFLILIFSIGLAKVISNKKGAYLLSASACTLILVGLFPVSIDIPHLLFSIAFFILLITSLKKAVVLL